MSFSEPWGTLPATEVAEWLADVGLDADASLDAEAVAAAAGCAVVASAGNSS